jgi:hypothetical protein
VTLLPKGLPLSFPDLITFAKKTVLNGSQSHLHLADAHLIVQLDGTMFPRQKSIWLLQMNNR